MIPRHLLILLIACAAVVFPAATATAAKPRNPYSGFNLSGINYGAQQWERAQRQGKRVWPYYNAPSRSSSRQSGVSVGAVIGGGGGAGTIIQGGGSRSSPRAYRRSRR